MIDGMEDPWEGLSARFLLIQDPDTMEYHPIIEAHGPITVPRTSGGTFVRVIRISYRKDWTKGEAWDHLQANPPTIQTIHGPMKPHYPMLSNGKMGHPFRKDHDEDDWGWTVRTWVRGAAQPSAKQRHPNTRPVRPPRVSRIDLISGDDWDPRDPRCIES